MTRALVFVVAAMLGGCGRELPEALDMEFDADARSAPLPDFAARAAERRAWTREMTEVARHEAERCPSTQHPPLGVDLTGGPTMSLLSLRHAPPQVVAMQAHPAALPGLAYYATTRADESPRASRSAIGCFVGHGRDTYCGDNADDTGLRELIADFDLDTRPEQLNATAWLHLVATMGGGRQILAMPGASTEGCHRPLSDDLAARLVPSVDVGPGRLSLSVPLDVRWRPTDGALWLTSRVEIAAGRVELSTDVLTRVDEAAALWGT